ncbi:MAG: hypothetical protein OXF74_06655 [Rhodobacteraceae bacterium]|nr:hypothetical protein [Paracoccaceae bacterium]
MCLAERLDASHFALSNMLKRLTHRHFKLGHELQPQSFEDCKDEPRAEFGGLSPREAYIMYSETILKPLHGADYLGRAGREKLALNRAKGRISIVSGVGFLEEVRPMIEEVGSSNVLHIIVEASRPDAPPDDSREQLDLSQFGVKEVRARNRNCDYLIASLTRQLPSICFGPADATGQSGHDRPPGADLPVSGPV